MDAILNQTQLSDLFFNFDKLHLNELYDGTDDAPNQEEIDVALRKDAEFFSEIIGGQVSPDELVNDYKRRV